MKLFTGTSPLTALDILQICLTLLCIVLAFAYPRLAGSFFVWVEEKLRFVGERRALALMLLFLLPLALRALLLPVYGPPTPAVHDEYGYLLQADTFASGRLTNPPVPLPRHFESIYILTRPTYTSQYQPAQGFLLAIGQRLAACPWLGVFLSMGVLCAMLYWMLLAWIPPVWAFVAGLLAIFQFGVLSYWMNSYFGGTVPAIGGTLVLGGLARLRNRPSVANAVVVATGLAVLFYSRPLEGALLFIMCAGVLCYWTFATEEVSLTEVVRRIAVPAGVVLIAAGTFAAYYNYRVTGSPAEFPYALNRKLYGTPQGFFWQKEFYVNTPMPGDIRQEYEQQLRNHERRKSLQGLILAMGGKIRTFWAFYLGPALTVPLIFIPFIWRGTNMGVALAAVLLIGFDNLTFFAFVPHYSAAITGLILLTVVLCLRRMRTAGPPGLFLSRALPVVCAVGLVLPMAGRMLEPVLPALRLWASEFQSPWPRERLRAQVLNGPGKHLVLVRYNYSAHNLDNEWVFNRADLDSARVVWARELDAASNAALIAHFAGRQLWLGEPDAYPARIVRYPRH